MVDSTLQYIKDLWNFIDSFVCIYQPSVSRDVHTQWLLWSGLQSLRKQTRSVEVAAVVFPQPAGGWPGNSWGPFSSNAGFMHGGAAGASLLRWWQTAVPAASKLDSKAAHHHRAQCFHNESKHHHSFNRSLVCSPVWRWLILCCFYED